MKCLMSLCRLCVHCQGLIQLVANVNTYWFCRGLYKCYLRLLIFVIVRGYCNTGLLMLECLLLKVDEE